MLGFMLALGFNDGTVEGKPVTIAAQRRGSVNVFVHPEDDSLDAIAASLRPGHERGPLARILFRS
jgi:hypothetical protein